MKKAEKESWWWNEEAQECVKRKRLAVECGGPTRRKTADRRRGRCSKRWKWRWQKPKRRCMRNCVGRKRGRDGSLMVMQRKRDGRMSSRFAWKRTLIKYADWQLSQNVERWKENLKSTELGQAVQKIKKRWSESFFEDDETNNNIWQPIRMQNTVCWGKKSKYVLKRIYKTTRLQNLNNEIARKHWYLKSEVNICEQHCVFVQRKRNTDAIFALRMSLE